MRQRLFVFHGDFQSAREWLTIADQHVAICDKDRDIIQVISSKLGGNALLWFSKLSVGLKKHWDIVRELFVAKWIDKLGDGEMKKKRMQLTRQLNPLQAGTLALDIFFATPIETSTPAIQNMCSTPPTPSVRDEAFTTALLAFETASDKSSALRTLWDTAVEFGKRSLSRYTASPHDTPATTNADASTHTTHVTMDQSIQTNMSVTDSVASIELSPASPALIWADEPHSPLTLPMCQPRNLSVLCSGTPKPFGTLQRRLQRSRARHRTCPSAMRHSQHATDPVHSPLQPTISIPPHSAAPLITPQKSSPQSLCVVPLDWSSDPGLVGLGRALEALGWKRS